MSTRLRMGLLTGLFLAAAAAPAQRASAQPAWDEGSFDTSGGDDASTDDDASADTQGSMPVDDDWGSASATTASSNTGGFAEDDTGAFEEETEATEDGETALEATLLGGFGVGTRSLTYPRELGPGKTDTGIDLALAFGIDIGFRTSATRSYGLHARYTTSSGLRVREQRIAEADRVYRARSHQVRGGFFADFGLGSRASLQLALDYLARNFSTRVPDVQTPSFTLSGPAFVLGLTVYMAEQKLFLRLAPEAQGIIQVGDQATERGASGAGIAGGGEAALGLRVTDAISVEGAYYESRARVGSGDAQVKDAIRFITLRLRGAL